MKPILHSLYLCDKTFHTEHLDRLAMFGPLGGQRFGFLVMDGHGCLIGELVGDCRRVLFKLRDSIPNKHSRGGQSAARYARLREEARHNLLRKIAEAAEKLFIEKGEPNNVGGLVLAGSGSLKNELQKSSLFHPKLKALVATVVDVSYGFEQGFYESVSLSAQALADAGLDRQRSVVESLFSLMMQGSDNCCFGVRDCVYALEAGALDRLIISEQSTMMRVELTKKKQHKSDTEANTHDGKSDAQDEEVEAEKVVIKFMTAKELKTKRELHAFDDGDLTIVKSEPALDWLLESYRNYGIKLEVVSDITQEGSQLLKGLGGFGGLLRYPVTFDHLDDDFMDGNGDDDDESPAADIDLDEYDF
eukprot:m.66481 g.66481  ORF g.66481 m.66481 type:complete len:361 (-) comp8189_c0_seq1:70-1152(-)